MLSDDCFDSEFLGFLCAHFNKEIKHPRIVDAYREAFDRYSDATFTELCGMAFRECKFLPEPQWFADRAVTIAARVLAEAESFAALPSVEMRELDSMTEQDRIDNLHRLRRMMGDVGMTSEEKAKKVARLNRLMGDDF